MSHGEMTIGKCEDEVWPVIKSTYIPIFIIQILKFFFNLVMIVNYFKIKLSNILNIDTSIVIN